MKRKIFIILFVLIYFDSIEAQKYMLIDSKHYPDYSKDCRKIGNCISEKKIINDTLLLTIFIDNNCRDLKAYRDSFSFNNEILSMNLIDTNKIWYSYKFNRINHKMDTFTHFRLNPISPCIGGYDIQRNQYKLIGFKKLPKGFQFDHANICDCPSKPIKYDIFHNDTINMINANGHKHGLWLKFFDNGKIEEKKYYNNGKLLGGKTFDRNGNDLHYIGDFEDGNSNILVDTLMNK